MRCQKIEEVLSDVAVQPWEFPGENLVANIMQTSGTTGLQKDAMVTHKNAIAYSLVRIHG